MNFELVFYGVVALIAFALFGAIFQWLRQPKRLPYIAVDGSNVLYWDDDTPSLNTVKRVAEQLRVDGFQAVIWFDANVGYLVSDRYLGPRALAHHLGLHPRYVRVAGKGTPADPLVIEAAATLNARIVTNDRFRDWEETYPQVKDKALFVRGSVRNGALKLRY
ncbi:NYN domain-containing protein [Actibacterium pelagium]|nr:hypothetical protein [Actibacterium pelagium]